MSRFFIFVFCFVLISAIGLVAGCRSTPKSVPPQVTAISTAPVILGQESDTGVAFSSRRSYYAEQIPATSPFDEAESTAFSSSSTYIPPANSAPSGYYSAAPATSTLPNYSTANSTPIPPAPISPASIPAAPWETPQQNFAQNNPVASTPQQNFAQNAQQNSLPPLTPESVFPENTPQFSASSSVNSSASNWAGVAAENSPAVSIDEAQERDDLERQRARLTALARQKKEVTAKTDSKSSHLEPLGNWAGPFEDRLKAINDDSPYATIASTSPYVEPYTVNPATEPELFDWEKEEKKGFDWDILDPVKFFTQVRDWMGMGPDEAKASVLMSKGREILLSNPNLADQKKSDEAAKLFEQAAKKWPDSVLAEEALFLAGECRFFADNYPKALLNYQTLLIKYHHSKWVNTSVRRLFAIGRYWEKESLKSGMPVNMADKSRPTTDTFGNAKKAYETVFINDPNGPISDDAVMALASAYLARGQKQGDHAFTQAAYYYAYLRENFPHSRHISKATEMELLARIHAYNGGDYDGKSLQEADVLAKMALRQRDGDTNLDEISDIKETVTEKQAERDWVMGQYYEKKRYYGASRMYYQKIVTNYPQTAQAERARTRLQTIKSYPDAPPGYTEQVKNLFIRKKKDEEVSEVSETHHAGQVP